MSETCNIGKGIQIKGTLTGDEDLVVEGAIEGHITLKNHITVQQSGDVTAEIATASLEVHGRVSGNIQADELVSLSSESNVVADIKTPRIVIEEGARFKGTIDMDVKLPPGL